MKNVVIFTMSILVCALSCSVNASPPQVKVEPPSRWINIAQHSDIPQIAPTGAIRYMYVDDQVNLTLPQKERYSRLTSKVLSEQGLSDISEIQIGFSADYETLIIHRADVIRDGFVVNSLKAESIKVFQQETELQNNIYSQSWTALIILDGVRVNDVVDFSYTVLGSNPVFSQQHFGSNYLEWPVPFDASYFRLLSNKDKNVKIKVNKPDLKYDTKKKGDTTEIIVRQTGVEAVREEDSTPSWYSQYGYISYSEYSNWEQVNDWALPLYQITQSIDNEFIEVLKGFENSANQDAITQSIHWVQDNIRYFGIEWGINSHAPSTPNETFHRRFGDCKDKALLMIAALNYLGVEAYPALVSTTLSKNIPNTLPSPGAFNHVIVTFFVDNKQYWVDATMTDQRGSYANMTFPNFHHALVVRPNLTTIEPMKPISGSALMANISVEQLFTLNGPNKPDQLTIETTFSGWQADSIRGFIAQAGISTAGISYHEYITQYFPNATSKGLLEVSDNPKDNIVVVKEIYEADEFAETIGQNKQLRIYAKDIIDTLWLPRVRQRSTPFILPYFVDIVIHTRIDHANIKEQMWFGEEQYSTPDNKWAHYSRKVSKNDNSVSVHHHYRSKNDVVEPSEFANYAQLINGIDEQLSFSIAYKQPPKFKNNDERARNLIQNLLNKN